MEPGNFSYAKIFFRRPLWTSANIRIAKFFLGACILSAAVIVYAAGFYRSLNQQPPAKNPLKEYFVSLAVPQYSGEGAYQATFGYLPENNSLTTADSMSNASPETDQSPAESRLIVRRSLNKPEGQAQFAIDPQLIDFLSDASGSRRDIIAAINQAPALQLPAVSRSIESAAAYRVRKNAYESSSEQVNNQQGADAIRIASSGYTDFGIVRGSRNHEKTIASVNQNSWSVKICIERFARINPLIKGSMLVRFDIHPGGHVIQESVRVVQSDINDPRVVNCVVRNIRRWRNFEALASSKGVYTLTQKFVF